jgi:hypothetical protein
VTNVEFRAWLRGFFELSGPGVALEPRQLQVIVNHLNLAEAVSGGLDDANLLLRAEIAGFRELAAPGAADLAALTAALRDGVMAAA